MYVTAENVMCAAIVIKTLLASNTRNSKCGFIPNVFFIL